MAFFLLLLPPLIAEKKKVPSTTVNKSISLGLKNDSQKLRKSVIIVIFTKANIENKRKNKLFSLKFNVIMKSLKFQKTENFRKRRKREDQETSFEIKTK